MISQNIEIEWPNGQISSSKVERLWLEVASEAGIDIPTGCLSGSCGACEIEVNGEVVRACISNAKAVKEGRVKVEFANDPFW